MDISCPACYAELSVEQEMVGQQARCPDCEAVFMVLPPPPPPVDWWVACPQCDLVTQTTDDFLGRTLTCTGCHAPFVVTTESLLSQPLVSPGERVDDKMIVKRVLGSPTGHLYHVHHDALQTDLMLRVLHEDYLAEEAWQDRFLDCLEPWLELPRHPHVQPCYGTRYIGSQPAWLMEDAIGGNLHLWLHSGTLYLGDRSAILERLLQLALELAWALDYLQEYDLVHGHLSLRNLLIDGAGRLCVSDVGVHQARLMVEQEGIYSPLEVTYRAPEQVGDGALTHQTDIHAWGLIVLALFLGEVAWEDGTRGAEALGLLHHAVTAANGVPIPAAPEALIDLLHLCLQADPHRRPPHAAALIDEITAMLIDFTGEPPHPIMPSLDYRRAITLGNRALCCFDLKLEEQAHDLLIEALEICPNHPELLFNDGLHQWRKGQITDTELVSLVAGLKDRVADREQLAVLAAQVHLERGEADPAVELLEPLTRDRLGSRSLRQTLQAARDHAEARQNDQLSLPAHRKAISSMSVGPQGRFLLSASDDTFMQYWDLGRGVKVHQVKVHSKTIQQVAFSPDGKRAITAAGEWDAPPPDPEAENTPPPEATLRLWELESESCVSTFHDLTIPVASACFSGTGRFGVALCKGHRLLVLDPASGRTVHDLPAYADPDQSIHLLAADNRVVAPGLGREQSCESPAIWDIITGQLVVNLAPMERQDYLFAFSDDGQFAVSGYRSAGQPSPVLYWDAVSGDIICEIPAHETGLAAICLSPGSTYFATVDVAGLCRIWETDGARCLHSFSIEDPGHAMFLPGSMEAPLFVYSEGTSIQVRRVGSLALAPFRFSSLTTLDSDLATSSHLREFLGDVRTELDRGHLRKAHEMAELALGMEEYADDAELRLLADLTAKHGPLKSLTDQHLIQTLEFDTAGIIQTGITPDTQLGLIACSEGVVYGVDLDTGEQHGAWQGPLDRLHSLNFATASSRALSCHYDHSLVVWDFRADDIRVLRRLSQSPGAAIAISPLGDFILAASDKVHFQQIDCRTGQVMRTFSGHTDRITSLHVSPDGLLALSGSLDRMVRVWELTTGACLRTTPFFKTPVRMARFSDNGRAALVGIDGFPLSVWNLVLNEEIAQVGSRQTRPESSAWTADSQWLLAGERSREVDGIPKLTLWRIGEEEPADTLAGLDGLPLCSVLSRDGQLALAGGSNRAVALWRLSWQHDVPELADWDDEAWPYLRIFLTRHTPLKEEAGETPTLQRSGRPRYQPEEVRELMAMLSQAGLGAIPEETVRQRLQNLAAIWRHPKSALS